MAMAMDTDDQTASIGWNQPFAYDQHCSFVLPELRIVVGSCFEIPYIDAHKAPFTARLSIDCGTDTF